MAWMTIEDREHDYAFRAPRESPTGQTVTTLRGEREGARRVHVLTEDRHEVYFEVVSYPGHVDHAKQYENHRRHILEQFDNAVVTPTSEDRFQALPATVFSFDSDNFGRRFSLIDSAARTYRIVYDHLYPLNEQILATMRIGGRDGAA